MHDDGSAPDAPRTQADEAAAVAHGLNPAAFAELIATARTEASSRRRRVPWPDLERLVLAAAQDVR